MIRRHNMMNAIMDVAAGHITGKEFTEDMTHQLSNAVDLLNREIDAMFVSVGGNDVNFAPIVEACIAQEPCFAQDFNSTDQGQSYQSDFAH